MKKAFLLPVLLAALGAELNAAIIQFDLRGTAGYGLLSGNEPSLAFPTTASGGEIGPGITYDTVNNVLDLSSVGWGSSQGFSDLSSMATASHIHGPTAPGGQNFTDTAGVLFSLTRSSSAVTGGVFTTLDLDTLFGPNAETKETELITGKWYINIHTLNNPGGEIRAFLAPFYSLTVSTNGNGTISPSGGTYLIGSNVVVIATPSVGHVFSGWSGDITGTNNPATVPMFYNKAITGNFIFVTNGVPISIALAAQISWLANNGVNYQVQAASVLTSNAWFNLGGQVAGNGSTNYFYDPVGNLQSRFYRVLTLP